MSDRPLVSYDPNPLLAWLYQRVFDAIEVDESWARAVRDADARGTVVYVLRNLSRVDFFALDYLTKSHHLPQVRFANDLGLWLLEPMQRGWLNALRPRTSSGDAADLERAVLSGASAVLFLKRPPHLLEGKARGKVEGDHLIRALFDVQRRGATRVLLVPQVFLWSRSPATRGGNVTDAIFGTNEWPGNVRSLTQFLANRRHATMRAGEPVDLNEFLARESDGASDDVLVRRLTYTLLRRLERERRAMVGPTRKPADRLREEVIRSPKLQKVIADMAGEGEKERAVIRQRALGMLRDMEAALDMSAIAALDRVFAQAVSRMFSAVEVDEKGIERLREHAKEGTLVLLPSHKSHMDYLALAWILYRHKLPLPLIAAGDNLNFFPMGPIFRRAGAFFIRRKFAGDRLYAAVVDAYMRRLIKDGWPLEFFLEGGRSRTGKLRPPKLGLLSIVVDAALGVPTHTTWFCPVSIGYERFVDEKALVHELTGGEKPKEDARAVMRSMELLLGRYGRLSVQFGKPMSLHDVLHELDSRSKPEDLTTMTPGRRRAVITRLAYSVMNEINAVTAVTPGSLVATALLAHERRGLPHADLVAACERLARTLHRSKARFSPSLAADRTRGDAVDGPLVRASAIREAVDLFVRAEHVQAHRIGDDTIYVVPPEARMSLDLAKNVIVHFFAPRALIATALLASPGPPLGFDAVRERVLSLSRLFKYEFTFRADASFEQIFDEEIATLEADGEVTRDVGAGLLAPKGEDGQAQIELYARILANFVEGYRIAARGLSALLRGPLATKEIVRRAMTAGERMFLAGEIARREAVSSPMLENAYSSFIDQGYLSRFEGKLALTPSFATASAVATIESRIVAMSAVVHG
ncbi:MAG: 1-acyl-sn-glycerol-3-phosphate acyltransferase [Polyangiaceae bacterium]